MKGRRDGHRGAERESAAANAARRETMSTRPADNEAFRRFLRRVWQRDVRPLLDDRRRAARAKSARVAGTAAGAAGLLADRLFGLRGKPFARFMTVMGSSIGAMLPDMFDWNWFRQADRQSQAAVADRVERSAADLDVREALELFELPPDLLELPPDAGREQLKEAWHAAARLWHPDRARTDEERAEFHLRFVAYQAAYERLCRHFDVTRKPGEDGG